jgi:hypothetical protein
MWWSSFVSSRLIFVLMFHLVIGITGCAISADSVRFNLLSTKPVVVRPKILATNMEGSDCSWAPFVHGNYSIAMDRALAKVPGGNVMTNVSFFVTEYPIAGFCVTVRGDVGSM